MIKLTPEHVGGRVLLSDGKIELVTHYATFEGDEWWEAGELVFSIDGKSFHHPDLPHCITLLLDAPNPLDLPVPDWCEDVVVWYHDEAIQILDREQFQDWRRASHVQPPQGWSPAPGQLPPKDKEEFN